MAGPRGFDPIAIVESSYALQGSESEWIDRLVEAVAPAIDQGIGVWGFTYRWGGGRPVITASATGNPALEHLVWKMREQLSPEYVAATFGARKSFCTASRLVAQLPLHLRELSDNFYRSQGFADVLAIHAADSDGGFILGSMLAEKQTVPAREMARWQLSPAPVNARLRQLAIS